MNIIIVLLISIIIVNIIQEYYFRKIFLNQIEVDLKFDKKNIFEGESFNIIGKISNYSKRDIRDIKLILVLDNNLIKDGNDTATRTDMQYINEIFSLNSMEEAKRKLSFTCNVRGAYKIQSCYLVISDFYYKNFYKKEIKFNEELLVYPRRITSKKMDEFTQNIIGEIESRNSLFTDPFIFNGIRDYQSYDSFNMINWNASAKTGNLMVNKPISTANRQVNLIMDLESDTLIYDEKKLEEVIRVTSILAEKFLDRGIGVSLTSNITNEIASNLKLETGYSRQHLERIRYSLSKINTRSNKLGIGDLIHEFIEKSSKNNSQSPTILVSSQLNSKMTEEFNKLYSINKSSIWINVIELEDENITKNIANTIKWRVA